jgi:hypothetical protein
VEDDLLSFHKELRQLAGSDMGVSVLVAEMTSPGRSARHGHFARKSISFDAGLASALFVSYLLLRWAKDTLDHRRDQHETDIVARRARTISLLIQDGMTMQEAHAVVNGQLEALARRSKDDPILAKVLAIASKHVTKPSQAREESDLAKNDESQSSAD